MADRSYEGPALDGTQQHISERDLDAEAESVEYATAAEEAGAEQTETWPSSATPREKLNSDQIAVIEAAADPTAKYDSAADLQQSLDLDVASDTYALNVLTRHWPDGRDGIVDEDRTHDLFGKENLTEEDADEIRQALLNGKSQYDLAEEYDYSRSVIGRYAKGDRDGLDESKIETPPVAYNREEREYEVVDDPAAESKERGQNRLEKDVDRESAAEDRGRSQGSNYSRVVAGVLVLVIGWVVARIVSRSSDGGDA